MQCQEVPHSALQRFCHRGNRPSNKTDQTRGSLGSPVQNNRQGQILCGRSFGEDDNLGRELHSAKTYDINLILFHNRLTIIAWQRKVKVTSLGIESCPGLSGQQPPFLSRPSCYLTVLQEVTKAFVCRVSYYAVPFSSFSIPGINSALQMGSKIYVQARREPSKMNTGQPPIITTERTRDGRGMKPDLIGSLAFI